MVGHGTPAQNAGERQIGWVFLDRDGTLNVKPPEGEYIEHPEELRLMPRAAEAVRMLNRAGMWTSVVTNQRGVALGRMTAADLVAVHARLELLLSHDGAALDAVYSCPHDVGACTCRKPDGGMLLQARRDQPGLDFKRAAIVGDSLNDIETGRRLGLTTVLLSQAARDHEALSIADHVVPDLLQAARLLAQPAAAP